MLSKEEQKQKNKDFWEGFKEFMRKTPSANGKRMNWLSYKTEVKDVYLRLEANNRGCGLHFDIQPKDDAIRAILWEQMGELKKVLSDEMPTSGDWHERFFDMNNHEISRISWTNDSYNYFLEKDENEIYAYLKSHLLGFDRFYQEYKEILISLMQ